LNPRLDLDAYNASHCEDELYHSRLNALSATQKGLDVQKHQGWQCHFPGQNGVFQLPEERKKVKVDAFVNHAAYIRFSLTLIKPVPVPVQLKHRAASLFTICADKSISGNSVCLIDEELTMQPQ